MSPVNSRAKGRRGELALCDIFRPWWPQVCTNLDQFGPLKMDLLNMPGWHVQAKWQERLNVWACLDQTLREANPGDVPILAFKRNRSPWFAALELDELIPLMRLKEQG
jgi:hypothetical protein